MKIFLLIFSAMFATIYSDAQDTLQHSVEGRKNSDAQQAKPYVILISADGFRYDLADKFDASNLKRYRQQGIEAAYMKPSYPSVTFPNHYTIVTGLYPSHHGLVDNSYYDVAKQNSYDMGDKKKVADSSWYGGTPLWVLAEQQQLLSASFYWVASESAIQGIHPSYYYLYNDKIKMDDRIYAVKNWLTLPEEKRPHLIFFYLPQVDHAEHVFGTSSDQAKEAVQLVDEAIAKLVKTTDSLHLPINYVFVSDHGMADIDTLHTLPAPLTIDTTRYKITGNDVLLHVYVKDKNDIQSIYEQCKKKCGRL